MELEIKWSKEDIEQKLREELRESGFRPIEIEEPEKEDGNKKRVRRKTFQWAFKPSISVRVRAEPDPNAVLEPVDAKPATPDSKVDGTESTVDEDDVDADVGIPEGTGLLPPGAATALNKAVEAEKKGKKVNSKRMAGETNERPD